MIRVVPDARHLRARELDDAAVAELREWFRDPEVSRWMSFPDDGRLEDHRRTRGSFWALVDDGDAPVGYIELDPEEAEPGPPGFLSLTFSVRPDLRGRGYGSRLLEWIKGYAAQEGYAALSAAVHADNAASLRCLARNGFVELEGANEHGYALYALEIGGSLELA